MYARQTKIINEVGLHARPASIFVLKAKEFSSDITIKRVGEGLGYNAKSIMKLMIAALVKNTEVELTADGVDEVAAVDTLVALIESGCGE